MAEDNLWQLVLSFYHVGPMKQTRVIRLEEKGLYLLNIFLTLDQYFFSSSVQTISNRKFFATVGMRGLEDTKQALEVHSTMFLLASLY